MVVKHLDLGSLTSERSDATMMKLLIGQKVFASDEHGASSAEYAILVSIIGAAALSAISIIGTGFSGLYNALIIRMIGWIS